MEAYVETPYRMKIILCYVNSYTIITCYHCIRLYRWCGCLFSVYLCTHVSTASYLTNNLGMMCLVSWWLVLIPTGAQIGNSVLLPEYTTSIYFPVWYHRWWSNLGEFQRQENTTGLSYGFPRFLMMKFHVWQCLYLIQKAGLSCLQIRHVWWKHIRCNNLSFDLVHCGGIGFSFQLPSFGSSL